MLAKVEQLAIPEVKILEYKIFQDDRGSFAETFRENELRSHGFPPFCQINQSTSAFGTLRGLHYQLRPCALGKLVRCIRGSIFDVAVDLRNNSPSFSKWVSAELHGSDGRMIYVPEGFAHGFLALEDETIVEYLQTDYWSSEHERSLLWNDHTLGLNWPSSKPNLSEKDKSAPPFDASRDYF